MKLSARRELSIKYMSIAEKTNLLGEGYNKDIKKSETKRLITFWNFVKSKLKPERFKDFLLGLEEEIRKERPRMDFGFTETYQAFGESKYIVKFCTSNINAVDYFLRSIRAEGMESSPKCVLSTIKENGIFDKTSKEDKKLKSNKVKKDDLEYAIARIMATTSDFIEKEENKQKLDLRNALKRMEIQCSDKMIEDNILCPVLNKDRYSENDLHHPNKLLDRYSIKFNRNNWFKVLLYFKAAQGKKSELENILKNDLLGVTPTQFSRKLYHMTGDYDFLVPFDCTNIIDLTTAIDKFVSNNGDLIISFTNTICRSEDNSEGSPLGAFDIHFFKALLINATQINNFEARISNILNSIKDKKELPLAEEGITPREDYVRNRIVDQDEETINNYLKNFRSFKEMGVETTIEFRDGKLLQLLLKFKFNDVSKKKDLINEFKEKTKKHEIIAIIYEPVRDPLTIMSIIMVKDLVEVEVLFDELRSFCRKIEFHMIFHQDYYSKVIEKIIRCRPCFKALIPENNNCKGECPKCKDSFT